MKINPLIFRAYDVRGIYERNLNKEVFQKIGFVLGKKKKKFVVGNDIRKSGKKLARALIKGLMAGRSKVIYTGATSFGETLFAGWKLKAFASLFITASHLPPEWNGLKFYFGNGVSFLEKDIMPIRDKVMKLDDREMKPINRIRFKKISVRKAYSNFILDKFSTIKNNKLKVVLDCKNGSMSLVAPQIFKKIGFKVFQINCSPDPNFKNENPEPTYESTKELRRKVLRQKSDLGVAFDGDGDRTVIIDDKIRYLSGNQIGAIIGKYILKNSKNKKIVMSVASSATAEEEFKKLGARVIRIPVGHSYLTFNCKKCNACFGMEESGHIVMPQYFWFDDALPVPLKIAEIILKEKKKLSELVNEIKIYPFEEIVFDCSDEAKFGVVENLVKEFKKEYEKVSTIDGVKVNFDDSWILIRASNTSPKIRLYIEAKNERKLKFLKDKFSKILKTCIKP